MLVQRKNWRKEHQTSHYFSDTTLVAACGSLRGWSCQSQCLVHLLLLAQHLHGTLQTSPHGDPSLNNRAAALSLLSSCALPPAMSQETDICSCSLIPLGLSLFLWPHLSLHLTTSYLIPSLRSILSMPARMPFLILICLRVCELLEDRCLGLSDLSIDIPALGDRQMGAVSAW